MTPRPDSPRRWWRPARPHDGSPTESGRGDAPGAHEPAPPEEAAPSGITVRPHPPDGASPERTGSWRAGLSLEQLRRSSEAGPDREGRPAALSVRVLRLMTLILAVALAYYGAGRLGLLRQVVVEGATVTPLWLPSGVAVAALFAFGPRITPGIALGMLAVTSSISTVSWYSVLIAVGNTLAPLASWYLLRLVGFRPSLERLRDGLALVFLGALGGMTVSAAVGTGTLLATDKILTAHVWPVWAAWWAGDALGVLVVVPVLVVLIRPRLPRDALGWVELLGLFAVTAALTWVAIYSPLDLLFLVFPLLIWAALRFELTGSAPAALIVSVLAVTAATNQQGPFAGRAMGEIMVNLQAFNVSVALTSLLLSSLMTERRHVRERIEDACQELAEVVDTLAPGASGRRTRGAGTLGPEEGEGHGRSGAGWGAG
ncbi:MASE1 domain-containing protein [Streptomyces sp. N1]|uniref:MASE1 domain-containing protein n=1 Tax=Streptomyces sp. N1 TaxID=576456 RepID=UPI00101080EE|nr:MASE1 domain-containing protein [Streptomyces sp. N1]